MNYEIREMLPEDGSRVLEIYRQGVEGGLATFEQNIPSWEVWDANHLNFSRFILEDEYENIVGWCALAAYSKRECYRGVAEVSIYLDSSVRGKGLGKILLKKMILDSEEHGIWTLQSGIFYENKVSIAIHQKSGFRIVGTREKIACIKGKWHDVVLMERRSKIVNNIVFG